MNSQFVQIALPIMVTFILAFFVQNRSFDLLNKRIDDVRGVLRAEMGVLRAEMSKNQSELLARLADMENRLDRRIEKLEVAKWK